MTDAARASQVSRRRTRIATLLRTYGVVLALVALVVAVALANPRFLSSTNIFNMLSQWAPAGVLAVAQTYVILTGGFDLSIASGFALAAVVAAALGQNEAPVVAFAAAIGSGLTLGTINGLLVAGIRINPFIATVGSGFVANGIALVVAGNTGYQVTNPDFLILGSGRWHGVPYSGMLLIAFLLVGGFVLSRTVYGQWVYAVGGNAEASRLAGLPVRRIVGSTYALSGLAMGVAGVLAASQVGSAQANLNPTIVFDVLTIVVVGGTSLGGGVGSMWRTAVGLGIIAAISNGFSVLNISPNYQNIVKGLIIIGALTLDAATRQLGSLASRWAPQARQPGQDEEGAA
jgi:ribose transport system permease protein